MYNITFGRLDGDSVSFDKITEIHTGKTIQELKPISEKDMLNSAFNIERMVFHLIGKDFNAIFYAKTDYISIRKIK